ncbi:MAG TPA: chemotaxis protein CheW [Gemmatimonadaceae bacterium]|jgi:purine-binding chemotaxis protein CheW|nr:chemotaxis protein CheW [Gemmatimonadaceae bacterium]
MTGSPAPSTSPRAAARPAQVAKIVSFALGDDLFAADIFSVERVLRHEAPTVVPNAPEWIEGVIEYLGRVVPVVNLRRRFGLAAVPVQPQTRILVLKSGAEWVGVVVDAVVEVTSFDATQLSPPPSLFRGLAGEYLKGIVRRSDRLLILLDVERLLAATEALHLAPDGGEATPHA